MKQFIDDNGQEWGFDIGNAHFFADETLTVELPAGAFSKEQIAQIMGGVPIIRCKDCKHFEADLDGMTMYCANEIMPTVFVCTGQGYCSEAERKEE